jgi:putative oxygen-independent coproporphyrinogen III oxidase
MDAFGIYVHWPFCAAKCPYCDFNSHVRHQPIDQDRYVSGYLREIEHMASLAPDRTVTSIFFGGGTPSLMAPVTVAAILDAIAGRWSVAAGTEVTLEANPSSVEADRFAGYRAAGVNRVSLGVQSLDDRQLRFLGRLHNADEAVAAAALARGIFPRISIDIIYARPGQTTAQWAQELGRAIALSPDHLSLYQLTIEPDTPFFDLQARGRLAVPDTDHAARLYEATQELTERAGLPAYEISNHAAPGNECRHNLVYWRGQDYAGIGPGAHGRLTVGGHRMAIATERNPERWWRQASAEGHGVMEFSPLRPEEAGDEFLLMGLRLTEGLEIARYEHLAGRTLAAARIDFLRENGFVEQLANGKLRATPAGFLVLDAIVADLAA